MRRFLVNAGKLVIRFVIACMVAGLFGVLVITLASLLSMLLDPSGRQLLDGGLLNSKLEFALMTWFLVGQYSSFVAGLIGAFWRPLRKPWIKSLQLSLLCASFAFVGSCNVILLAWIPVNLEKELWVMVAAAVVAVALGIIAAVNTIWWVERPASRELATENPGVIPPLQSKELLQ